MPTRIYSSQVTNQLTGESVILSARDQYVLNNKILRQRAVWEKQAQLATADQLNADLAEKRRQLSTLLAFTLGVDDKINWDELVDRREYPDPPLLSTFKAGGFTQVIGFMFKSKGKKYEEEAKRRYEAALNEYELNRTEFLRTQAEYNNSLGEVRQKYETGEVSGVEKYLSMVLNNSKYPDYVSTDYEVNYDTNARTAVVKVVLPRSEQIPREESYKYVQAQSSVIPKLLTDRAFSDLFESIQYQIIIRTIHEIFESDYVSSTDVVVVNGYVSGINKGTGKEEEKCIMTVQASRDEFTAINLAYVDPEHCFKQLKGVTAGALVALSPVRPILTLDKNDRRLIKADELIGEFNAGKNLAIMDWQEFEVLIRDLFNREFSSATCRVEVTQASRDAGVDAIAFDEDPIRGGKIVIQAKRYNNLVPLTAVRDLYGTVQAENALKGILVTTSYYGPDAIKFCRDKPLTLINGEQLLYLFQKHGYDFNIELTKKRSASSRLWRGQRS